MEPGGARGRGFELHRRASEPRHPWPNHGQLDQLAEQDTEKPTATLALDQVAQGGLVDRTIYQAAATWEVELAGRLSNPAFRQQIADLLKLIPKN